MKKLLSMLDEVTKLLTKYPSLRDNDERLMANVWKSHIGNLESKNAFDVLHMLSKHQLPSYESVSRCRRKIQQTNPELRGEKWTERQSRAKKIKKVIAI